MTKDIRPQLDLLIALQNIDVEINKIDKQLVRIPQERETLGGEYLSIKRKLDADQEDKAKTDKEKADLEIELAQSQSWIRERETKLFSIKTNKEYQAALKEVAQTKMANKEREKKVLELMQKSEELEKNITQLSQALSDKEGEYKKIDEELKEKEKNLSIEKEKIGKSRPDIESKIEKALLKRYLLVKERYTDPMALAEKGVCRGCHMNIPPQLFNNVRKFDDVHSCPRCFRLLYAIEEKQENKKGE